MNASAKEPMKIVKGEDHSKETLKVAGQAFSLTETSAVQTVQFDTS